MGKDPVQEERPEPRQAPKEDHQTVHPRLSSTGARHYLASHVPRRRGGIRWILFRLIILEVLNCVFSLFLSFDEFYGVKYRF